MEPLINAARSLGIDTAEPRILGVGANVVVHLSPAPIVARIATLTAEMRGGASFYLERERDVSTALAAKGVNVIGPTDLVDPGPHTTGELTFLLLEYAELQPVDPESKQHAVEVGTAFAELSTAMASLPSRLGRTDPGQPWAEVTRLAKTVQRTTDPTAMRRINDTTARLRLSEPDDTWQLIHGDAHRVNVALRGGRAVWFDFEDANLRPVAWDLATLRRSWPMAGDVACELLEVDTESTTMQWHFELRELYALLWNLLYRQRYERAQDATARRLAEWMERH